VAVFAVAVYPPKTKPAVASPAAADAALAVFKFAAVDQAPMFEPAACHSSVAAVASGVPPPKANPEVTGPFVDPRRDLAVDKSPSSDQLVPFHNSVAPVRGLPGTKPPNTKAEVLDAPKPDALSLVAFISAISVHAVSFQDSVTADPGAGFPPTANADALVPAVAMYCLAVFKSPTSVHVEPFHFSFTAVRLPVVPP